MFLNGTKKMKLDELNILFIALIFSKNILKNVSGGDFIKLEISLWNRYSNR